MAKQEPQVETITMSDGRVVDFPGKRKILKESVVTADGVVQVRLDFRNGETRLFTIPAPLLLKFAAHGAEQKLGDETAGLEAVDDCVLAVDAVIDRLYNGDWTVRREAGGMAGTSVLLRALVAVTGQSPEKVKAFLSEKTQAEKLALRNSPKIKPVVDKLEAEKAEKKGPNAIDTDAMLAGLAD